MSVLWELGEATVTEVRDRVDPTLAYTGISSMIRTLEMKGYVSHRRGEGKTHVYFPVIEAEKAANPRSAVCSTRSMAALRSSSWRISWIRRSFPIRSSLACASCSRVRQRSGRGLRLEHS